MNVCYAVVGKPFAEWLKKQVSDRNEAIAAKRDLMANMDPKIAQKLQESNHVSISKGKSAHLLKVGSKRRRGKEEIRQAKEAEANRDQEHALRLQNLRNAEAQMAQMRQQYEAMEQQVELHKGAYEYVKQMVNEGEIDLDHQGNVQPLQSKMKE